MPVTTVSISINGCSNLKRASRQTANTGREDDMKNGIIINGVSYKIVRVPCVAGFPDPCERCDIVKFCDKYGQNVCVIFEKANGTLCHFKKVKKDPK